MAAPVTSDDLKAYFGLAGVILSAILGVMAFAQKRRDGQVAKLKQVQDDAIHDALSGQEIRAKLDQMLINTGDLRESFEAHIREDRDNFRSLDRAQERTTTEIANLKSWTESLARQLQKRGAG